MSLNKFKSFTLKDKHDAAELAAQERDVKADLAELGAVVKAKKRASKKK